MERLYGSRIGIPRDTIAIPDKTSIASMLPQGGGGGTILVWPLPESGYRLDILGSSGAIVHSS